MLRLLPVALLLLLAPIRAQAQSTPSTVDLQLVLAVDISRSMDHDEQRLQRAGYVAALRDPEVIRAIEDGPLGRIAVTYVEWAGQGLQTILVPWTLVDGSAAAARVADRLAALPLQRLRRTSISDALSFSSRHFETSGFTSPRRVIDVSGDGPNNSGFLVTGARDAVLEQGITINGLPIMLKTGLPSGFFDVRDLDLYYEDCVIGGFGAFIVTVQDAARFADAIRRKLILEIAGSTPSPRIVPAQFTAPRSAQLSAQTDCQIGEKLWDAWMNGME
ncbi:MAG: DUF1194 domain-containing protein [Thalassobaculaceae bacterium]|nr:DUF1194 domain-containing protein [Thalassobaculaceae bacterium]